MYFGPTPKDCITPLGGELLIRSWQCVTYIQVLLPYLPSCRHAFLQFSLLIPSLQHKMQADHGSGNSKSTHVGAATVAAPQVGVPPSGFAYRASNRRAFFVGFSASFWYQLDSRSSLELADSCQSIYAANCVATAQV